MDGGKTILLVEDEALVRQSMMQFMEVVGYRVVAAEEGRSALAADLDGIDLAVLDLGLPDMQGEDLYWALVEKKPGLPVLFLSGDSSAGPPADAGLDRARFFLAKPIDPHEILERLKDLLGDS